MNKRYVANNRQNLQIIVNLPKQQVTITFNSGYGLRREAYFITRNEELQKALEEDARFNKSYRLAEIDNMNISEYNARKAIELSQMPEPTQDMEFRTNTDAKEWINRTHGVPYAKIVNKAMLTIEYAKLGITLKINN